MLRCQEVEVEIGVLRKLLRQPVVRILEADMISETEEADIDR